MKKFLCVALAIIISFSQIAAVNAMALAGSPTEASIVKIAAGFNNTYVLKSDGTVWGCGDNNYGQIGNMSKYGKYVYSLTKINELSDIGTITFAYSNLLAVEYDGTAWSLGRYNVDQQYDSKDDNNLSPYLTLKPKKITGIGKIKDISAGEYFAVARHTDNSLYSIQMDKLRTRKINNIPSYEKGVFFTARKTGYFINNDNIVWAWNGYDFEAFKYVDFPVFSSIAEAKTRTFITKKDGTVWTWLSNPAQMTQIKELSNIVKIVNMGEANIVALSKGGQVWKISEESLDVQQIKGFEDIGDIAAGSSHIVGLSRKGILYAYGDNSSGQLGIGNSYFSAKPEQIKDMKDAIGATASKSFGAVLKKDGTVWTWGSNSFGQLGDGTKASRYKPVKVKDLDNVIAVSLGDYHGMALKNDGTVWTWGSNSYGQIGDDSTIDRSVPIKVEELKDITAISAGSTFSVALRKDGRVYCWGYTSYGKTEKKDDINIKLPFIVKELGSVTAISAGYDHILALKRDTSIWGWGGDSYAQLGISEDDDIDVQIPDRLNRPSNILQTYAGKYYSMFLKNDGTMYAWGNNEDGRLGVDSYKSTSGGLKMKDIKDIKRIFIGASHSFILNTGGVVFSWGNNRFGQLGINDYINKHSAAQVPALTNVSILAPGENYTIAVKNDGTVWTWGSNADGLMGNGKREAVFQTTPKECIFK